MRSVIIPTIAKCDNIPQLGRTNQTQNGIVRKAILFAIYTCKDFTWIISAYEKYWIPSVFPSDGFVNRPFIRMHGWSWSRVRAPPIFFLKIPAVLEILYPCSYYLHCGQSEAYFHAPSLPVWYLVWAQKLSDFNWREIDQDNSVEPIYKNPKSSKFMTRYCVDP